MLLKLVSLYDIKANVFSGVNAVPNINAFTRVLSDAINGSEQSEIWVKHPEDFRLVCLGEFDDVTGAIEPTNEFLLELSTLVRTVS